MLAAEALHCRPQLQLKADSTQQNADCRVIKAEMAVFTRGEHSAWSESSAACPRPRGGRCRAEKVAPGEFSTLQRRGPQSRAHILGCVFVQRRRKRQLARPEGPSRCFGCGSFVEERWSSGEARRAEPTSLFLVASDQKRQILALVFSP